MAKRKDLLLKESTVSRMMGLAGIGALTNPFLREQHDFGGPTNLVVIKKRKWKKATIWKKNWTKVMKNKILKN